VTAGVIRIDGVDIREVTVPSLRGQIGLVAQEATLFGGTIRENILYGRLDATEAEVIAAARAANADDFIRALPDGYDTVVGDRGSRLSGGQRQRVAIARALAAEPRVLILDESVAALDVSIQAQVLNLLADIRDETSISFVLISHDLAVVRQLTEQIVVMWRGRVVERGETADVLDHPQDEYTKLLRSSVPRPGWKPKQRITLAAG
jgi:subfamily B ATP-binding cassette protein MsbA